MVERIIYRYRCGIAWRDVPEVFGPWQTIWTWHRRMAGDGTWDTVPPRLLTDADAASLVDLVGVGRFHDRAGAPARNQHHPPYRGAGANYTDLHTEPPDQATGRFRGGWSAKGHHLVDGNGRPLVTLVGPGRAAEAPMFLHLMRRLRIRRA